MHQKFPLCILVLILSVHLAITQKFEVISSIAGAASYAIASKGALLYSGEGNPDVESGIYLVVLKNACGELQTEKVVLIR